MRSLLMAVFAATAVLAGMLVPPAEAAIPANGRSWELVTVNPPSSSRVTGLKPMSDDGERLVYGALGPPKGSSAGTAIGASGITTRGPSGWVDTPVGIPYAFGGFGFALLGPVVAVAFSADEQTKLWLSATPLTPGAPQDLQEVALYRELPGGAVQFIAKVEGPGGEPANYFYFTDISEDGSRVVFETDLHLLPADAARTEGASVYVWDAGGLRLVDVDSGGALLSTCGSRISRANGMSAAGDRAFFTVLPNCGQLGKVYLANLASGATTEISASKCTRVDCNAPAEASFAGATPDGAFAYLTTSQQLTNADEDSGRDLYRYSVASGQLSLLSGGSPALTGEASSERVFPSEGGDRVYFRAYGEMLTGEPASGEKLFMADGGGLHLVAAAQFPSTPELQLSAGGNRALFVTETPLLPADTDKQADVYLYDAASGGLTRISSSPTAGNGELSVRIEPTGLMNRRDNIENGVLRPYHAIDAAGDRAFFETAESLLPEDTNGVLDVYEWWNGSLGLVSAGNQPLRSELGGASWDGQSVVFATSASLLRRDVDGESRDLYSARLGGGFPEPPEDPGCNSATCPLPAGGRVTRPAPASMKPLPGSRGTLRVVDVASKAKKGAIAVVVSVPAAGKVSAVISTRAKGKKLVLAEGSTRAKHAGKVGLKLRLTRSARRGPGGAKQAQLTVSQGSSKASQSVKVSLP